MEFPSYLTPAGQQIISIISSMKYTLRENASTCNNKEIFGHHRPPNSTICLDNIKNKISPVKHYVNETVYHEAVHVAQTCKGSNLNIETPLSENKLNDVKRSAKIITGKAFYDPREMEAYYLEDKPEIVLYQLKKYCM